MAGDVGGRSCTDSELLLLHPELLSQEFLLLTLEQKNIAVENDIRINKDNLTDLYVQHAIPLPQRDLPKNRWGKMMEKKREQHELKSETKRSSAVDVLSKKRPLIVFDGSSTSTSIKVKKTDNGDDDQLKAPPQASYTGNAFQKLSNSSSSVSTLLLSSNLPMNNKMEHNNNNKQNHDLTHRKSPLGPMKLPLSPVRTTPVKLKRAAPKEEAEAMNNLKPPQAKRKIQHVTWP